MQVEYTSIFYYLSSDSLQAQNPHLWTTGIAQITSLPAKPRWRQVCFLLLNIPFHAAHRHLGITHLKAIWKFQIFSNGCGKSSNLIYVALSFLFSLIWCVCMSVNRSIWYAGTYYYVQETLTWWLQRHSSVVMICFVLLVFQVIRYSYNAVGYL